MALSSLLRADIVAPAVQAVAVTAGAVSASFTVTLSLVVIPLIQFSPEAVLIQQWRLQYLAGFYTVRPMTTVCALSWGYLALTASSTLATILCLASALMLCSGIPFALLVLRPVNGALSIRAEKLAGPGTGEYALIYSKDEKASLETEKKYSTLELVQTWGKYNSFRGVVQTLGLLCGVCAVSIWR